MAIKKLIKPKEENYLGFNITLKSTTRKGDLVYLNFLKSVFKTGAMQITTEKAVVLESQSEEIYKFQNKNYHVLHGTLVRYVILPTDQWYNEENKEIGTNTDIPKGKYPHAYRTDYIFIPAAHRFFIKTHSKISKSLVIDFLDKALRRHIEGSETINVYSISSHNSIQEIIDSFKITALDITITYTNDDSGDSAAEDIDKLLKGANAGTSEIILKPDASGDLAKDSKLVKGLLNLAKENGTAIANVIKTAGAKQTKIITSNFPEIFNLPIIENESRVLSLFKAIMNKYRNGKE